MSKSTSSAFIKLLLMLVLAVFLIVYTLVNWNSLMQTNRFRLFILILLGALSIYRLIDHFLEWRNSRKQTEQPN
jgi:uncharacterized protein YqhQ